MKAISIRQPWAWLILNAGKDYENRDWPTKFRGRVLIHASKGMTRAEYDGASLYVREVVHPCITIPPFEALERGGIVGEVTITDCVTDSCSPWFNGWYGFALANPKPLTFQPCRGMLKFFEVPSQPGGSR